MRTCSHYSPEEEIEMTSGGLDEAFAENVNLTPGKLSHRFHQKQKTRFKVHLLDSSKAFNCLSWPSSACNVIIYYR